ncbi:MAG TPA: hypothetical protein VIV58_25380 [Kofleriaceae bacterium]
MSERKRGGRRHHKDLQLCRQVFDALTYALAELDDPQIEGLVLASVVPAPTAARMLVTLAPTREDLAPEAIEDVLACIADCAAELREEVAALSKHLHSGQNRILIVKPEIEMIILRKLLVLIMVMS